MIDQPLALAGVLAAVVALGFWLGRAFRWGKSIGVSLLVILAGAVLSNAGLVPSASPVYDLITGPITSLAIVWLLIAVDLRALRGAGPRMLGAFALAVTGTAAGALTASALLAGRLGDETWRLAGVMTGTYAGGSLNFVAVDRAVDLGDAIFTAAVASDNVLTALWIGATLMLPVWLRRRWPVAIEAPAAEAGREAAVDDPFDGRFQATLGGLSALLALGLGITWLSEQIAAHLPGVAILWLTTLALFAGLVPAVRRLGGALQLGLLALHFFFAVIGIGSRIAEIVRVGPDVFVFTAIVVAVHGLIVFGVARRVGLDLGTTAVASQAAVGGPSTAIALAAARGWHHLSAPGTLVGLLGYAVGTYVGLAVAALVRGFAG